MTKITEAEIFARALARRDEFAGCMCGRDHDLDCVMMVLEESGTGASVSISEFKRQFNKSDLKTNRMIASAIKDKIISNDGRSIRIVNYT